MKLVNNASFQIMKYIALLVMLMENLYYILNLPDKMEKMNKFMDNVYIIVVFPIIKIKKI